MLPKVQPAPKSETWRGSTSEGISPFGPKVGCWRSRIFRVIGEITTGFEENSRAPSASQAWPARFSIMLLLSKAWTCGFREKIGKAELSGKGRFRFISVKKSSVPAAHKTFGA